MSLLQPKAKETLQSYQRRIIDTYAAEAKIAPSRIKGAGNGVFAPCATPAGVTIGYYAGKQITHEEAERNPSAYILEVAHNTNLERCKVIPLSRPDEGGRRSILIDASDRSVANWCSMVNDYRGSGKQPNVQFKKNGALVTIAQLRKGEELLLDYGNDYWNAMSKCDKLQAKYAKPASCEGGACAMESSDLTGQSDVKPVKKAAKKEGQDEVVPKKTRVTTNQTNVNPVQAVKTTRVKKTAAGQEPEPKAQVPKPETAAQPVTTRVARKSSVQPLPAKTRPSPVKSRQSPVKTGVTQQMIPQPPSRPRVKKSTDEQQQQQQAAALPKKQQVMKKQPETILKVKSPIAKKTAVRQQKTVQNSGLFSW